MKKVTIMMAVFAVLLLIPIATAVEKPGNTTIQRDPGDQVRP